MAMLLLILTQTVKLAIAVYVALVQNITVQLLHSSEHGFFCIAGRCS